jgi:hypothetical protein
MNHQLETITHKLFDYCQANNWAGYDPYDALNSELFKRLPFLDFWLPRLALTQLLKRSPINFRPLLLISKTQNPKALALFLMAFLKLPQNGQFEQGKNIDMMVESIKTLRSPDAPYWCWGYSFPWQGRSVLAPRGEPNIVCTVSVANALTDIYEKNHSTDCLTMATSAAEYLLNELYWSEGDNAGFSYPLPSFQTRVHNANFLGAALLCRVYKHTGEKKYLEPALRVARYSASMQHPDGGWDYGEQDKQNWIDNFHTGYNLGALRTLCHYLNTDEFEPHIRRGFKFYRDHFFRKDGAPKYFHNKTYPIDIHSVAQSIITLIEFRDLDQNNIALAYRVLEWTLANMWDDRGFFYYQVTPYYKNKISYMRWSQAWMLLALAKLYEQHKTDII